MGWLWSGRLCGGHNSKRRYYTTHISKTISYRIYSTLLWFFWILFGSLAMSPNITPLKYHHQLPYLIQWSGGEHLRHSLLFLPIGYRNGSEITLYQWLKICSCYIAGNKWKVRKIQRRERLIHSGGVRIMSTCKWMRRLEQTGKRWLNTLGIHSKTFKTDFTTRSRLVYPRNCPFRSSVVWV